MTHRKAKSILAMLLAVIMAFAVVIAAAPTQAQAVTQEEIDALKAERDAIRAQGDEKQQQIDELEREKGDVVELKKALDERCAILREQISLTTQEIELYEGLIAEKAAEVEDARRVADEQFVRYKARLRAMEENGSYSYIDIILNTTNLGELLTLIDDIDEIVRSDEMLEAQYLAALEALRKVKQEYEDYQAEQQEKKNELEEEEAELERQTEEATQLILNIKADIEAHTKELLEIEAAEARAQQTLDEKIAEREREKEAERQRQLQQQQQQSGGTVSSGGTVTGSGSFIWPCSCTYITSRVGGRVHPVSNVWKYHSGMDIGCQYGDAVWASDGGTVIIAGENGGYGNCVMIDHGNGYYTLYGHLSSIATSVGATVSQGTVIGYVGSTGVSTGPHLHFEIRDSNNTAIDFNGWFSGLTYAPTA